MRVSRSGGALDDRWWWSDSVGDEHPGRPLQALPSQCSAVLAELGLGTHHEADHFVRCTNRSPHLPRRTPTRCERTELESPLRLSW